MRMNLSGPPPFASRNLDSKSWRVLALSLPTNEWVECSRVAIRLNTREPSRGTGMCVVTRPSDIPSLLDTPLAMHTIHVASQRRNNPATDRASSLCVLLLVAESETNLADPRQTHFLHDFLAVFLTFSFTDYGTRIAPYRCEHPPIRTHAGHATHVTEEGAEDAGRPGTAEAGESVEVKGQQNVSVLNVLSTQASLAPADPLAARPQH